MLPSRSMPTSRTTAYGVGQATARATGIAPGSSVSSAVGQAIAVTVGTTSGSNTVLAIGKPSPSGSRRGIPAPIRLPVAPLEPQLSSGSAHVPSGDDGSDCDANSNPRR